MSVRLYVVTDTKSDGEFLVAAKTRDSAMNYIAKKVLMNLSARPATFMQCLRKDGESVIGEADDLAAIGIGGGSENINEKPTETK